MLYDVNKEKKITSIPYRKDYDRWRKNISDQAYDKIFLALNKKVDQNEVHTSSWIPGSNWSKTPFQPIYIACNKDQENAAKFFGLILWEVMLERPEYWSFGRYQLEGIKIKGLTYFRVDIEDCK